MKHLVGFIILLSIFIFWLYSVCVFEAVCAWGHVSVYACVCVCVGACVCV